MTFTVTFSKDETVYRTNLIHDPLFTYRPLNTSGDPLHLFRWGGSAPYGAFTAELSKFGAYSFRLNSTTSAPDASFCANTDTWQYFPVTPFMVYQASCWVYATDDCTIRTDIDWYDDPDDGTSFDYDTKSTPILGGQWTQVYITKSAPSGAHGADFYVEKESSATPIAIYIDGVLFEERDLSGNLSNYPPDKVFDGDVTPAYPPLNNTLTVEWNGTPGLSSSLMTNVTAEWSDSTLSVDIRQGRSTSQEPTPAGNCSIEILDPTQIPDLDVLIRVYYDT